MHQYLTSVIQFNLLLFLNSLIQYGISLLIFFLIEKILFLHLLLLFFYVSFYPETIPKPNSSFFPFLFLKIVSFFLPFSFFCNLFDLQIVPSFSIPKFNFDPFSLFHPWMKTNFPIMQQIHLTPITFTLTKIHLSSLSLPCSIARTTILGLAQ